MFMKLFSRKTDVMNLLESAGFSRSNPYYIVKQGKVCVCVRVYVFVFVCVTVCVYVIYFY